MQLHCFALEPNINSRLIYSCEAELAQLSRLADVYRDIW